MSKLLLDKVTYQRLKKSSYAEMYAFLHKLVREVYEAGANADVDPTIRYVAIKEVTEYVCGNCGARLEFDND